MQTTSLKVGDKVATPKAFTSPIGCHFAAGSTFTVEIVGERSIALRSDGPDASRVWISDGLFLVAEGR